MKTNNINDLAFDFAKDYVTKNTGFEVGSGNWRARVNMCASTYIAGYNKASENMYSLETISNAFEAEGIYFSVEFLQKMIDNIK